MTTNTQRGAVADIDYLIDAFTLSARGNRDNLIKDAAAELATLRQCRSALKLLLNIHDGIADGGKGITPEDWEAARFICERSI